MPRQKLGLANMKTVKTSRPIMILAAGAALLLLVCFGAAGREPRHNGRPLRFWLHRMKATI
jgi:hypothetical protein